MKYKKKPQAVLLLEDGTVFHGKAAGICGTATGEICFNTGMTGYQEIFTDPSYYRQILVSTTSHIGNYGVNALDIESESLKISALVCKKFSETYSRKAANASINQYFENHGLVAISDIDTRAIVRHIRNKGAMNAVVSSDETDIEKLRSMLSQVPQMEGLELSSKVSTQKPYCLGDTNAKFKVAVLDLGVKKNILRCLIRRDCYLQVFPMNTSYKDMEKWNPDGYLITNGPGDPGAMPEIVKTVTEIMGGGKPLFGICLGHQVMALACGLKTHKMHNGHRGVNHPVKNLRTGKCEITSQNHGFVVSLEEAEKHNNVEVTHIHLNDGTLAGLKLRENRTFSVQYHPESSAGPNDSRYLFDDFINLMKEHVKENQMEINNF